MKGLAVSTAMSEIVLKNRIWVCSLFSEQESPWVECDFLFFSFFPT